MDFLTLQTIMNETEEVAKDIQNDPTNFSSWQDLISSIFNEERMYVLLDQLLLSLIIIVIGMIIIKLLKFIIIRFFNIKMRSKFKGTDKRNDTLISVIKNIVTVFIWFVIIMMVLETFNLPVRTLLAGAGIVGLAIGFGSQSLVKDIITGFFIILENQFDKGDFIKVNTSGSTIAEGEVVSMGLRLCRIKGWEGEVFYIPNGSITEVVNYTQGNTVAMLDTSIDPDEDLIYVSEVMEAFIEQYWKTDSKIVKRPELLGLNGFQNGEAMMRILVETEPMEHFGVLRRMRLALKRELKNNNINNSVPKIDIVQKYSNNQGES